MTPSNPQPLARTEKRLKCLTTALAVLPLAALVLLSCSDALTESPDGAIASGPDAATAAACKTVTPDARVVFLNRFAGTYTSANESSPANNETNLAAGNPVLAPWDASAEDFAAMQQCLTEVLAPFNVIITDVEPVVEPYHEIAFTSSDSVFVGHPDLTSLVDFGCVPADNAVSFVFAATGSPLMACQSAAFVVGFSQGLSRVAENCEDAMTFTSECASQVEFTDTTQTCGNSNGPAPCTCHRELSTQNSFQLLTSTFGACPK